MTRKLYHENPYLHTFSSAVVEGVDIDGKPGVILEQTAFYPTSGGQPCDTGTLNDVAVIEVLEDAEHRIIHLLEKPLEDSQVEGQIHWERRFDHMQQHTGQHLLSQAFIKICDAETISFHLGAESSTIDLNRSGLDAAMVQAAEHFANRHIYENRDVLAHIVNKDELHRLPVRKLPTVEDNIRIIEIKDCDYSPCGGTHCTRTGEIGMIKITRVDHYKSGRRVHFLCGWRALKDYHHKAEILRQLSEMMSSGETDLPQNLQKIQEDAKTLRREQNNVTKQLLEYEARALVADREEYGDIYILKKVFADRNPKDLKILAMKILEQTSNTVILFGGKAEGKASLIFLRTEDLSFNMGQLMKAACAVMNGRGGGQPRQAQGGGAEVEKLEDALKQAVEDLNI